MADGQVWAYCASGYRASTCAWLLACAGTDVVVAEKLHANLDRHVDLGRPTAAVDDLGG